MEDNQGTDSQESPNIAKTGLSYFQNWVSVIGGILSVTFFSTIFVLFVLDFKAQEPNPYLGIVTYFIAPILLIFSLLLIPLGVWIERKRRKRGDRLAHFPQIDFNNPRHQKYAYVTIGVVVTFLLFSVVGSYKA